MLTKERKAKNTNMLALLIIRSQLQLICQVNGGKPKYMREMQKSSFGTDVHRIFSTISLVAWLFLPGVK